MTLVLWMLVGCHDAEVAEPVEADLSGGVDWVRLTRSDRVEVAVLPAEVVGAPDAVQQLGPQVPGRLLAWHVAPGDVVQAGAPLADLASPELASLAARRTELAATVTQLEARVAVEQEAVERGVRSRADALALEASLAEARAALRAATRTLGAHSDTSTASGDRWTWRAPVTGVVDAITCPLGLVQEDARCVTLVRPEGVVLQVEVSERHLAKLAGPVRAELEAGDGRRWDFVEIGRSAVLDRRTRTRTFRFGVVGEATPLQGASGRARLSIAAPDDAVVLPDAALTRIDAAPTVFVRREAAGEPVSVEILGRSGADRVVRGVGVDQEVAASGVFLLKSLALAEAP